LLYFGTSVFELRESTAPSTITVISTESSTSDGRSTKILTVFSSPSPELTVRVTTEPASTLPYWRGDIPRTVSFGSLLSSSCTVSTVSPRSTRVCFASESISPSTDGSVTCLVLSPLAIYTYTVEPIVVFTPAFGKHSIV